MSRISKIIKWCAPTKLGLTFSLLLCSLTGNGQYESILDSLHKKLPATKDTARLYCLVDISYYTVFSDPGKARGYAAKALELATEMSYVYGQGESYYALGTVHHFSHDYDSARFFHDKAIECYREVDNSVALASALTVKGLGLMNQGYLVEAEAPLLEGLDLMLNNNAKSADLAIHYNNVSNCYLLQEKHEKAIYYCQKSIAIKEEIKSSDLSSGYMNLSIIYKSMGKFSLALENSLKALNIAKEDEDVEQEHTIYSNMGSLYYVMDDYKRAEDHLEKAIDYFRAKDQFLSLSRALPNLALVYYHSGRTALAKETLLECIDIKKELGSTDQLGDAYISLSSIYCDEGNYEEAMAYCQKTIDVSKEAADMKGVAQGYLAMATAYKKKKDYQNGIQYGLQAYIIAKDEGYLIVLKEISLELSELYELAGDYTQSVLFLKRFNTYRDSLWDKDKLKQISEMEAKYELQNQRRLLEESEKEVALLQSKSEIAVRDKRISTLRERMLIIGLASLIIIAILVFVFQLSRIRRGKKMLKREQEWAKERVENELREKEQLEERLELFSTQVAQKNAMLEEFKIQLSELENEKGGSPSFIHLFKLIETNIGSEEEWQEFKKHFNQLHPSFFYQLKAQHPNLSDSDVRLAALIKLKLNQKEIANILGIGLTSVKKARYRLRKRLELKEGSNLSDFIREEV